MKQLASFEGRSPLAQRLFSFLLVGFTILSLSAWSAAQELEATLTGTVTDPTGAVVAGATILVHSQDTGADVRTVTTSTTGSFNITNIPAGHYTVTVSQQGFQAFVARDLTLYTAEKHTLDVQLKTGAASERVEVSAENVSIQTTTAEQSGTVTGEQVRELALSNRNFEQLVLLQPGVASMLPDKPGFGLQSSTTVAVNGARTGANNWTVDGADINDSGSNGTLLNTPSIDAIQEFSLQRSNYDAAFGRSGGGQVVLATKSGANQYHGSAYSFNRNTDYNANTFTQRGNIALAIAGGTPPSTAATDNPRPAEHYNDFGFTIGGPLIIPKVWHPDRNKTFFFWSEEWRRANTPVPMTFTVPTAAELGGTFSTPITLLPQGETAAACLSNGNTTINPTCFSKNAQAYLNAFMDAYPANANGQLVTNFSQLNNFREDNIRLDQNIGDKVRVFGRYMQDSTPETFPFGLWGSLNYPGVQPTSLNAPGRNLVINATATLSPRVVNEVEFVDAYGAINSNLVNAIADSPKFTSTLTGLTTYQDPYGRAPTIGFASNNVGLTNQNAPYFERNKDRNLFDNVSFQQGNHTIRTGITVSWMVKTENASNGAASFSFSNTNGNPEFANFLLGIADSYSQPDKDTVPYLHYVNFEAYLQDDWKVTRKLTLNLGVRYSYFPSPFDSNDTLLNFNPAFFNPANAPSIYPSGTNAAGANIAGTMVPTSPNANAATYANGLIFPVGSTCAAAKAVSSTASCSPFGGLVNPNSNNNFGPRFGLAYDPFGNGKWSIRAGYGLFYDRLLNGIWEQNAFDDPPLVQTSRINNSSKVPVNLFDNVANGAAAPVPTTPVNIVVTGTPIFKVPSYQDYSLSVQHALMQNTVLEVSYVGTRGTHLLGDIDLNQPTVAARLANPTADANALVNYPGFGSIRSRNPIFTSNYNSLQLSLNRRFSNGLSLGASYTWSKLLNTQPVDRDSGVQDSYNIRDAYGLSTLNTPQIFVLSYVYDLPFYRDQRGLLGHLAGGWEISGITSVQSGQSVTVTQGNDPFATAANNNSGLNLAREGLIQIRADQIQNSTSGPKSVTQFFNTSAFQLASGAFGTERPGAVLGPGFQLWDISLMKNIRFAERVHLQLRFEGFNAFNHGSPNAINTNIQSSAFGSVTGYHDPRTLQLGGKLEF